MKSKVVILDNIRSAHNVGSIFRTADGAGVKKIYLLGVTPTPIDRFGRVQTEISKTSLGASEMIEWEYVKNEDVSELISKLKTDNFKVVAIEQTPDSVNLEDYIVPERVAYIFGNEIDGVGEKLLSLTDQIVEIPMQGSKESLNVAVSAGIALFHR